MNNEKNELEIRGSKVFPAVISSEHKVARGDYEEVIVHRSDAIDTSRFPVPLLLEHNPENQIGVVENPRFEGDKLVADIRFANDELSKTYEADVIDKIRNSLSIGYQAIQSYMENGIRYITETLIMEASLVSVPADPGARFRKSNSQILKNFYTRSMKMEQEQKLSRNESRKLREEISEIRHIGKKHNMSDEADKFIENGNSLEQFRSYVMDKMSNNEPLPTPLCDGLGNSVRNAPAFNRGYGEEYSVANAILGMDDVSKRGFEWEVSQDLERQQPKSNPNAVIIDMKRTMTSGTAGANTIETNVSSSIQDFMQQKAVLQNVGASNFAGNVGNLDISVGSSDSGVTALATDGTTQAGEETPTLTKLSLVAKRFGTVIPLSYGFLQQSTPDVEGYVRRLIAETFAKNMDDQIIGGSGSSGNVTGLLNTTGINVVSNSGSEVTFANFMQAISELGTDAVDVSKLKMIVNPANLDNLVTSVKYGSGASASASPILDMKADSNGQVGTFMGYPVYATSKISADTYLMGDFSHLAIASWGGLELAKDDFYDTRRFNCAITGIHTFDAGALNPTAFCKITKA